MMNKAGAMQKNLTALELFCGIGGFATAVAAAPVRVVAAYDQSPAALSVYRRNFPQHKAYQADLEKVTVAELTEASADLWWLSPPCQPYSIRGRQADLDDPRARSLVRLMEIFPQLPVACRPRYLALENVAGFAGSRARQALCSLLTGLGYQLRERQLCPTVLGVPSRRPRYYLTASLNGFSPDLLPEVSPRRLQEYLDPELQHEVLAELMLPSEVAARFGDGFRLLDPADDGAYTTCFTAGYGKSLMHAGSYLQCGAGIRRFAPAEIARLLHFPEGFRFPETLSMRNCWKLLGNSLSVVAVQSILADFPERSLSSLQGA